MTRIRDLGVTVGKLPAGSLNKITDVPGVTVGHCTVSQDEIQTGVTVIVPPGNVFLNKLPAACFVQNGYGKSLGTVQLDELGCLETPVALTNTLNVGIVHDALVEYTIRACEGEDIPVYSVNPVVGECNDSFLNDIRKRAVTKEHVFAAFEHACTDFEEGSAGAGRGTSCYGFKGGIGSSSRKLVIDDTEYHVGILVQSNHGRTEDLLIGHVPVGKLLKDQTEPAVTDRGSIIMVMATDLPLDSRQIRRVLKRCTVGLVNTGSHLGHGSGDIMIGFSTAYSVPGRNDSGIVQVPLLNENRIEQVFDAAAEATEEAVLNSMISAETVTGYQSHTRKSLLQFLQKYPEMLK